ncbi:MAG: hypothetical protein VXX79_16485, partial [Pseudomonadota bacterium]|nr:hypothetical protein [Pseudomonadota bacterium]
MQSNFLYQRAEYLGGLAATVSFVESLSKITNFGDVKVCGIWMYANGVWFRLFQVAQSMLFLSFKFSRRSMMKLASREDRPDYSHPVFWAPFVV